MNLQDKTWAKFNGAHKTPYNVSVPLLKMEQSSSTAEIAAIWEELWSNLHHHGHVGFASYMAIPQLVRITKEKNIVDWNLFGLCSLIEQQRHEKDNPDLPAAFQQYYQQGLTDLAYLALNSLKTDQEDTMFVTALSTIATASGRTRLGKAILQLEDEKMLEEFLDQL